MDPATTLQNLGGDGRLAGFVIGQCQIIYQVSRVVGGVPHRHHLRRVEAGDGFQQRLIDQRLDVARQQRREDRARVRLEDILRRQPPVVRLLSGGCTGSNWMTVGVCATVETNFG